MCGIFGFIGHLDEQVAHRCVRELAHRGPDGEGVWQETGVTLGHRRLAILDLTDNASQPMSDESGRYRIVFNGEIYNFVEIRRELESNGHRFRTESDTEVLLAAFIRWGESCQDRLNGMWSFAVWDAVARSLFLSRDRFGKKPLFYSLTSQGFAFASEMKAITPLLDHPTPNTDLITDRTRIFHYESTDECLIEEIQRLPPGHCAWLRDGHLNRTRWWCTLDHLPDVPRHYDEQVERFRELFLDACRLRMRSDVPIGTALSGGLDSSATVCSMAHIAENIADDRMGRSWQHAFVATFPGTPVDEARYARAVTEHLGIPATFVDVDPSLAIDDLDRQLYLFEELYITSPIPFMRTYGAVKAHGISVTLDGHGADELFGGYTFDLLVALNDAGVNLRRALDIVDTYVHATPGDSSQFTDLPNPWLILANWHAKRLARLVLGKKSIDQRLDQDHPLWGRLDSLSRQLYVSTHETILPTLLRNYDRYSMANGVEIRMPFMDHRIVTYASVLPWTAKIRNGFSKAIVRESMQPFIPGEITWRRSKIGFTSPIVDWMKGPLRTFLLDTLASRDFAHCDLVDAEMTAAAIRKVIDSDDALFLDGERAWTLLSPYLWQRAFMRRACSSNQVDPV